jgi:tetratricopeptide (TPR) repeat protein
MNDSSSSLILNRTTFSKIEENKKLKFENDSYSKEQFLHLIYLSDKCRRYEDSLLAFEQMIQKYPGSMSREERELFENSIKCLIKTYQKNLNKISGFIKEVRKQREIELSNRENILDKSQISPENNVILDSLHEEKKHIENETIIICKKVIKLIDNFLMKNLNFRNSSIRKSHSKGDSTEISNFIKMDIKNNNPYTEKESEVFLFRLKGDLYKYLSQVQSKEDSEILLKSADEYFNKSIEIGKKYLDSFNYVYLESILAYSKFLQDFKMDSESAMNLLLNIYRMEGVREILSEHDKNVEEDKDLEKGQFFNTRGSLYDPYLEHDLDPGVIDLLKSIKKMIVDLNEK